MYELLKASLKKTAAADKLNGAREFLQLLILKIIHDNGFFKSLAFVGGTALRIIYETRRFSEDLDFAVINKEAYDFKKLVKILKTNLTQYGFRGETTLHGQTTVHKADIKFADLLYPLGLSSLKRQKLLIKMEIDTNPPAGFHTELSAVNKMSLVFNITHFDLPSLYATKLCACFYRKYTKGRDIYDLVWYLGKKTIPNLTVLNNALRQAGEKSPSIDEKNFKEFLLKKLEDIDFKHAQKDAANFLIDKNELRLLDLKTIKQIIK